MDPAVERARAPRHTPIHPEEPTASSGELRPAEARAMLSELSGTPLRPGSAWDDEARARLASFQSTEGLAATGELDDATVARLQSRFEHVIEARTTNDAARIQSPTAAEHHQVAEIFREALHAVDTFALQLAVDSPVRAAYMKDAREFSASALRAFECGEITAGQAASIASNMRNGVMHEARAGLSPAGQLLSKFIKEEGLTLPALFQKYAAKTFGKAVKDLTPAELDSLCLKIAERAGVTNPKVDAAAKFAPKLGKAMVAVTIAVAFYQVATAEDKVGEGVKQAASLGAFFAGAKIGAVVGTAACGPVCGVVGGLAAGIFASLVAEQAAERGYQWIKG